MTANSGVQTQTAVLAEPATETEKYLAGLWVELVGLERIAASDKFLEVGGNSLTLNIILNRVQSETGLSIKPQLFFDDERSSIFELAKELDALRQAKKGA
jgi:acyl carrier protein